MKRNRTNRVCGTRRHGVLAWRRQGGTPRGVYVDPEFHGKFKGDAAPVKNITTQTAYWIQTDHESGIG